MADDLRLRATVDDKATGPLRDIGRAVRQVAQSGSIAPLQREFVGLHGAIAVVGRELRTVTVPALGALGLAGGGIIASVIGVTRALSGLADKTLDLRYLSKEVGFATNEIKAFGAAAEHFRIDPGQATAGLRAFSRNVEDLKANLGGARDELIQHGAGDVVAALRRSRTNVEALGVAVKRMKEMSAAGNNIGAKRFAELMFGDQSFARMDMEEIQKRLRIFGPQTDAEVRAAEEYADAVNSIGRSLEGLKNSVGRAVLPELSGAMREASQFFDANKERIAVGIGEAIKDVSKAMRETDWSGFAGGVEQIGRLIKDAYDWGKWLAGLKMPDWLMRLMPIDQPSRKTGGAQNSRVDDQSALIDAKREQLAKIDAAINGSDVSPAAMSRLKERRELLSREIDNLRDGLKKLREEFEATAKPMSYSGSGFGDNPGVIRASLGGTGGGLPYTGGAPSIVGPGGAGWAGAGGGGAAGSSGAIKQPSVGSAAPVGPRSPSGGTNDAASFDRTFKGTALEGKWAQVEAAAKANGVPAGVMAAIMAHETGRGGNLNGNNVAGVMDPATGWARKRQYSSIDDGISDAGKVIGKNYARANGDLDTMGKFYAPPGAANDPRGLNGGWAGGVRSFLRGSGAELSSSDRVKELQGSAAAIRKQAINGQLRSQLDYAAAKSGLIAEITSGGQAGIGSGGPRTGSTRHDHGGAADLRLRDPETGRLLDMRNPDDQRRMSAFVRNSVAAGATGVGAGLGYMGPNRIHIGGGRPAVWGGADWIREAWRQGREQPADRGAIDAALAAQTGKAAQLTGSASIKVDVNAPKGTSVGVGYGGIFKDMELRRHPQMQPAESGEPEKAL